MIFSKPKAPFIENRLNAKTLFLLEAVKVMPPQLITKVLSSALRDRQDIRASDMRLLAQELDREADRRDRSY